MKSLMISLLLVATSSQVYATEGTFSVHEWGTFTSVQGSNGQVLGGMNHEEELLPSFVVGRNVLTEEMKPGPFHRPCRFSKAMPICDDDVVASPTAPVIHASDVTQKMETPVVYFHSDRPREARVTVGFPRGIISQYFPQPVSFLPLLGRATSLAGGSATFKVNVLTAPVEVPAVAANSVYAPARKVDANYVTSGTENEKFIFYRGLGNFQTEVNVTSAAGALTVNNTRGNYVSAVFLLEVSPLGGSVQALGGLSGNSKLTVSVEQLQKLRGARKAQYPFMLEASSLLNEALQKSGMNRDEAEAMTNTWKNSYFRNPGLRVLYVLSRAETDALLPLTIEPQPQSVERALVGRIEVILDTEEASMLAALQNDTLSPGMLGRFAEPKLRRLLQLTQDPTLGDKIRALIAKVQ